MATNHRILSGQEFYNGSIENLGTVTTTIGNQDKKINFNKTYVYGIFPYSPRTHGLQIDHPFLGEFARKLAGIYGTQWSSWIKNHDRISLTDYIRMQRAIIQRTSEQLVKLSFFLMVSDEKEWKLYKMTNLEFEELTTMVRASIREDIKGNVRINENPEYPNVKLLSDFINLSKLNLSNNIAQPSNYLRHFALIAVGEVFYFSEDN